MDQPFESDVMEDLADESSFSSADEAFDGFEAMEEEGFESEDAMSNMMDEFEESEDGFAEEAEAGFEDEFETDYGEDYFEEYEAGDELDALEEAVADALDAEDSDEFFGRLLGGLSRVAGMARRGARTAGRVAQRAGQAAGQARRVAGRVQRVAGRAARSPNPMANLLGQLMPLLQQYAAQGFDEMDALEDLADQFAEEDLDEALPILAGVAARAAVRPVLRRTAAQLSRPVRRQMVRATTQAARTLVRRQGPRAVRALPRIAQSVGRTAARRRVPPSRLPQAIRSTTARVAARPTLVRRLARPTARVTPPAMSRRVGMGMGDRQRITLRGPVEITILGR